MDREQYCREIEAYLCRKNDGHLIRIVGPSFERVTAWAARGVPFKVACHGIDRCFERYYAKGPRRRPVHIAFCEADVLDAFDAWRRAIGLRADGVAEESEAFQADQDAARRPEIHARRVSLASHLDRTLSRLAASAARHELPAALQKVLEATRSEVAAFRSLPSPVRGEARARVLSRLAELDARMMTAVRHECPPSTLAALREEAARQLVPFRDRMSEDVYRRSLDAALDRLSREREGLPILTVE